MTSSYKIAVIGGTGKSGSYLLQELFSNQFKVKALVRNPQKVAQIPAGVEIVLGDVTDIDAINRLLKGCTHVVSMLGMGTPPSEPTIFAQSTQHILSAMQQEGILRYIVTTGLNVDTPSDQKSEQTQFGTQWMKQNFPISTANKQIEYDFLVNSTVDWTLIRLPLIELTEENVLVHTDSKDCTGNKISAKSLAKFVVTQLFSKEFSRQAPFVFNQV